MRLGEELKQFLPAYDPMSMLKDYYFKQTRGSKVETLPRSVDLGAAGDIAYFRNKLNQTLNPQAREKYKKQLQALEDAVVVYRIG